MMVQATEDDEADDTKRERRFDVLCAARSRACEERAVGRLARLAVHLRVSTFFVSIFAGGLGPVGGRALIGKRGAAGGGCKVQTQDSASENESWPARCTYYYCGYINACMHAYMQIANQPSDD